MKALVSDTLITRPRSEFINILVGFVVMLSISPIVAGFVAMHLLGAKSLVFRSLAEHGMSAYMPFFLSPFWTRRGIGGGRE